MRDNLLSSGWKKVETYARRHEGLPLYGPLRRLKRLQVVSPYPYDNIYHCCPQKTASMWFRRVFSSPVVYKNTGLDIFPLEWRDSQYFTIAENLRDIKFHKPLPRRTIGANLYIGYPTFLTIPKPARYKVFFVLRDPRDIVVSWYYSARYSHSLIEPIIRIRRDLSGLSFSDGLNYAIDYLQDVGLFWVQRSWIQVPENHENFRLLHYEKLAQDNISFLRELFVFLSITLPENDLQQLQKRFDFTRLAPKPEDTSVNAPTHYRKGVVGDWKEQFDRRNIQHFNEVTGDLVDVLGY